MNNLIDAFKARKLKRHGRSGESIGPYRNAKERHVNLSFMIQRANGAQVAQREEGR
jgi:hypothetical protein